MRNLRNQAGIELFPLQVELFSLSRTHVTHAMAHART